VEEGLIGEMEDPFEAVKWQQVLGGEGFLRKLRDHWNQRVKRPKNYGQKINWSAVGAERILERVSEHFQSDLERHSQQSGTAVRDCAVLGSRRIESRRKCVVVPNAQQQFGGSDDSANQDPTRSNSEGLKASNMS
jgi:hypothetical protein